eukprot:scaffold20605_cov72-Isochrysis_galbana.AAC.1
MASPTRATASPRAADRNQHGVPRLSPPRVSPAPAIRPRLRPALPPVFAHGVAYRRVARHGVQGGADRVAEQRDWAGGGRVGRRTRGSGGCAGAAGGRAAPRGRVGPGRRSSGAAALRRLGETWAVGSGSRGGSTRGRKERRDIGGEAGGSGIGGSGNGSGGGGRGCGSGGGDRHRTGGVAERRGPAWGLVARRGWRWR